MSDGSFREGYDIGRRMNYSLYSAMIVKNTVPIDAELSDYRHLDGVADFFSKAPGSDINFYIGLLQGFTLSSPRRL